MRNLVFLLTSIEFKFKDLAEFNWIYVNAAPQQISLTSFNKKLSMSLIEFCEVLTLKDIEFLGKKRIPRF